MIDNFDSFKTKNFCSSFKNLRTVKRQDDTFVTKKGLESRVNIEYGI